MIVTPLFQAGKTFPIGQNASKWRRLAQRGCPLRILNGNRKASLDSLIHQALPLLKIRLRSNAHRPAPPRQRQSGLFEQGGITHDPLRDQAMQRETTLINLLMSSHGMPPNILAIWLGKIFHAHCSKNKRHPQVPFNFVPGKDQAAASALIWADRRLLVRDALFLWTIFLSVMRSRMATDCWKTP